MAERFFNFKQDQGWIKLELLDFIEKLAKKREPVRAAIQCQPGFPGQAVDFG